MYKAAFNLIEGSFVGKYGGAGLNFYPASLQYAPEASFCNRHPV
jgi:hypothetical protein